METQRDFCRFITNHIYALQKISNFQRQGLRKNIQILINFDVFYKKGRGTKI